MPPKKAKRAAQEAEAETNEELLRLREEMKTLKAQLVSDENESAVQEDIQELMHKERQQDPNKDNGMENIKDLHNSFNLLREEVAIMREELTICESSVLQWKDFQMQMATGAAPFLEQNTIQDAMTSMHSADKWKSLNIKDMVTDLTTVQNKLNAERKFKAAEEFHALIEVMEVAREISNVTPSATSWLKKAADDAIGVCLRLGRDQRGQPIFWNCLVKQLADKMASRGVPSGSGASSSSNPPVEFACQNCTKGGFPNQMHSLAECAKRRNPCKMECRYCPLDVETNAYPCHWRENCPNYRKRDRNYTYKNISYNRSTF